VAYYSNHSSMGILPELGHTTSVGGGFPGSFRLVLDPLTLLPDNEQVPVVCLEMGDAGEYVLCRMVVPAWVR
jgi:hypothetical protein